LEPRRRIRFEMARPAAARSSSSNENDGATSDFARLRWPMPKANLENPPASRRSWTLLLRAYGRQIAPAHGRSV
jgi:hypothetical protein